MKLSHCLSAIALACLPVLGSAAPITYTFSGTAAFGEGQGDTRDFVLTISGNTNQANFVDADPAEDYWIVDSGQPYPNGGLAYSLTVGGNAYTFDDSIVGGIYVYNFVSGVVGFGFADQGDWLLLSNSALAGYAMQQDFGPVGGSLAVDVQPILSLQGADPLNLTYTKLSNVTFTAALDNVVPEPGSFALAGLALAGLALTRRRKA